MASKVSPLPPTAGGGGGTSGGTEGARTTVGGGTAGETAKPKPDQKPKFFNTTRFSGKMYRAKQNLSRMTRRDICKEAIPGVLLVSTLSFLLLSLGIFMVSFGEDRYIVDIIVLGALSITMAIVSFFLGMLLTFRPLFADQKRKDDEENSATASTVASQNPTRALGQDIPGRKCDQPATSTASTSEFLSWRGEVTTSGPSDVVNVPVSSQEAPGRESLYDRDSLQAFQGPRGKWHPPSPPSVARPAKIRSGTEKIAALPLSDSESEGERGVDNIDDDHGDDESISDESDCQIHVRRSLDDEIRKVL